MKTVIIEKTKNVDLLAIIDITEQSDSVVSDMLNALITNKWLNDCFRKWHGKKNFMCRER